MIEEAQALDERKEEAFSSSLAAVYRERLVGMTHLAEATLIALRAPIARLIYGANLLGVQGGDEEPQAAAARRDLRASTEEIAAWVRRMQRFVRGRSFEVLPLSGVVELSQQICRLRRPTLRVKVVPSTEDSYLFTDLVVAVHLIAEVVFELADVSGAQEVVIAEAVASSKAGHVVVSIGKLPSDHETGVHLPWGQPFQICGSVVEDGGGSDPEFRTQTQKVHTVNMLATELGGEILEGEGPSLQLVLPRAPLREGP